MPCSDDPTAVTMAYMIYNGDIYENGTTCCALSLGTDEGIITIVEFQREAMSYDTFKEDFSGTWCSTQDSTGYAAGTANLGWVVEYIGNVYPQGSYIYYPDESYMLADASVLLDIKADREGTYTINLTLASTSSDCIVYDVKNIAITPTNGTIDEDE